jgi:hypothetical protein
MSLLVVLALVLAYVVVVAFALALVRGAKRADEDAEREHRALRRQMRKSRAHLQVVSDDDPERDIPSRRAG